MPASELLNVAGRTPLLKQIEPSKEVRRGGSGDISGTPEVLSHGSFDSARGRPAQGVKRKVSFSQTRAKGLHQM